MWSVPFHPSQAVKFTNVDFKVLLPTASTAWNFLASTASVSSNEDADPSNNTLIPRGITTFERADLALTIASPADGSVVTQGDVINYSVQAVNANSPYAFALKAGEKAVVRFAQPQGTEFQGNSPNTDWVCTAGDDASTDPVTPYQECTYTVPQGQSISPGTALPELTFPALVKVSSGTVPAQASIKGVDASGHEFAESVWENNTDNLAVDAQPNTDMDMALSKRIDTTVLDAKSASDLPVRYTLQVSRVSGLLNPQGITVTDTLPAGVHYAGFSGTDWNCDGSSEQRITCTYNNGALVVLGDTNPANLPALYIDATVPTSTLQTGVASDVSLKNNAALKVENEPPSNASNNNTASADTTITNRTSLVVAKTASTDVVASGQSYYYDIQVTNKEGPLAVLEGQTITITDKLDGRLEFIDHSGSSAGWSCTSDGQTLGPTITCTHSAGLAVKEASTLRLHVKPHLASNEFVSIANTADFQGVDGRNTSGAVTNEVTTNLSQLTSDLSIDKSASITTDPKFVHGDGTSGSEVVYTIEVKNNVVPGQTQTAQTVIVTDRVNNLFTTVRANALGQDVVPLYPNERYITADVEIPTVTSGTQPTGSCTISGNNGSVSADVTCTLNNVPVSDDLKYTVTIKARQYVDPRSDTDQQNSIDNTARVRSTDTAEYTGEGYHPNEDTASVTLTAIAGMTVTKEPTPTAAAAGQPILYTLTAKNAGPSAARKVQLQDKLPVGAIWVTAPSFPRNNGTCVLGDGEGQTIPIVIGEAIEASHNQLICSFNDNVTININGQGVVNYRLRSVTSNPPASLENKVVVRTQTQESNLQNNEATATVTLNEPEVDVLINMKHNNDGIPLVTSNTQYTITVTNNATSKSYATGVRMINRFPQPGSTATFEFVSLDEVRSSNQTSNPLDLSHCTTVPAKDATTGELICEFPWLAPGESVDIKFTMRPATLDSGRSVGTIFHAASVSADLERLSSLDTDANNQTSDRTSTYDPAQVSDPDALRLVDLSVTKTTDIPQGQKVSVGDEITYQLTVKNEEDPAATPPQHFVDGNAQVRDVLPEGLEVLTPLPSACSFEASTREVTCMVTDLEAGQVVTFDIPTRITSLAANQQTLNNTAVLENLGDPNEPNNESRVEVPVASVDLKLVKSVEPNVARAGDTLTYTLSVSNQGPDISKGAQIVDTLPAGLNFVSSDGCTFSSGAITCEVSDLAAGDAPKTFTITTQIAEDAVPGEITNTATVNAPGDTNPDDNTDTATTRLIEVQPVPVLGHIGLMLLSVLMLMLGRRRLHHMV